MPSPIQEYLAKGSRLVESVAVISRLADANGRFSDYRLWRMHAPCAFPCLGVVLYDHDQTIPFGERLWAAALLAGLAGISRIRTEHSMWAATFCAFQASMGIRAMRPVTSAGASRPLGSISPLSIRCRETAARPRDAFGGHAGTGVAICSTERRERAVSPAASPSLRSAMGSAKRSAKIYRVW